MPREDQSQAPDCPLVKLDLATCGAKGVQDATKIVALLSEASSQIDRAQRHRELKAEPAPPSQADQNRLARLEKDNGKLMNKNEKLQQFKMRLLRDYRLPEAPKPLEIGLTFARLLRRIGKKLRLQSSGARGDAATSTSEH